MPGVRVPRILIVIAKLIGKYSEINQTPNFPPRIFCLELFIRVLSYESFFLFLFSLFTPIGFELSGAGFALTPLPSDQFSDRTVDAVQRR